MSALICPNKNLPEWVALEEAVGRFEAMRDFMEHNGEIRDPETVKAKIEFRDNSEFAPFARISNPYTSDVTGEPWVKFYRGEPLDDQNTDLTRSIETVSKICETLSRQLNTEYEIVTPELAKKITEDAKNPWNGESAFFIGNKVYFVGSRISTNMALHEFSHPFVRAIAKSNPELFNSLYDQLVKTKEGQDIINEVNSLYPDLNPHEVDVERTLFMEEVIVRSLAKAAEYKIDSEKGPSTFMDFIKELLYRIKQMLRKAFGQKIDISKLDAVTTLDKLAEMLTKGDNFKIDTTYTSKEDYVAYAR